MERGLVAVFHGQNGNSLTQFVHIRFDVEICYVKKTIQNIPQSFTANEGIRLHRLV